MCRTTYIGDRSRQAARKRTACQRGWTHPESSKRSRSRSAQHLILPSTIGVVSNLRIGTSGWNYPAGRGTWNGVFYPAAAKGRGAGRAGKPKFDELAYYAEHFDTVEVNTTFYGQ